MTVVKPSHPNNKVAHVALLPSSIQNQGQQMTAKVPVVLVALGFPLTIAWITVLGWYPLHLLVSVIESLRAALAMG